MTNLSFDISRSPRVLSGIGRSGKIGSLANEVAGKVTRAFVVCDAALVSLGIADGIVESLRAAGIGTTLFAEVAGDPTAALIDKAADVVREQRSHLVVGVGGGAALDVAKMVSAVGSGSSAADSFALAALPFPDVVLPCLLIPTTAGTGSEATRTAIFTSGDGRKVWAWDEKLKPAAVILDPALTVSLPASMTVATGLDVLVHAIEACTGRRADPVSDAAALHAIRLVIDWLPCALANPNDLAARGNMLAAAFLAGMAIDSCGTGIAHALGHALGAVAGIHHGRAVAASLAVTLDLNVQADSERYVPIAECFGARGDAGQTAALYKSFLGRVGFDCRLGRHDLDPERLTAVAMGEENRPMRENNAHEFTVGDIRAAFAGLASPG